MKPDFVVTIEDAAADHGYDMATVRSRAAKWQGLVDDFDPAWLGLTAAFLDEDDPRPAREQFDAKYCGGWHPSPRARITSDLIMKYPGDPDCPPLAKRQFRDETIVLYEYEMIGIVQPDGSCEVSRMD